MVNGRTTGWDQSSLCWRSDRRTRVSLSPVVGHWGASELARAVSFEGAPVTFLLIPLWSITWRLSTGRRDWCPGSSLCCQTEPASLGTLKSLVSIYSPVKLGKSHEIKRCLLLGRKVMINLVSILKSRDITLPTKVHLVKAMVFPVVMYGCESWTIKKAER